MGNRLSALSYTGSVALYDLKQLAFDTDAEGRTVRVSTVSDDGECFHESSEAFDFTAGILRMFPEFVESLSVDGLSREEPGTGSRPVRVPSSKAGGGHSGNTASSSF